MLAIRLQQTEYAQTVNYCLYTQSSQQDAQDALGNLAYLWVDDMNQAKISRTFCI